MKQFKFLWILAAGLLSLVMTSCENQDVEFPDFDHSSVYFAYQYPVRTIVLGEDIVDNTLDNEHKCEIYATMGGVYNNTHRIDIDVVVNNSLVNNLFFGDGSPVLAMPSAYYTLSGNQISLDQEMQGSVQVQLTDAFFADAQSLKNTYVIPLQMTSVANADSILSGKPKFDGAVRGNTADWDVEPKDFVLYCVKFINPWHANYLRRGKDVITKDGVTTNVVRHSTYVENDEVIHLSTLSMNSLQLPMDFYNKEGQNLNFKVNLNFDANQNVTAVPFESSYNLNDTVRVYNITTSGNGSFVKEGDKDSWGNKDRDALYLQYNIGYEVEIKYPKRGLPDDIQQVTYNTTDTLVVRDRGVTIETFSPSYNVN
ncbi:MAG: DUF5627 domain-containing protein [Mangrovibacterium sp.]